MFNKISVKYNFILKSKRNIQVLSRERKKKTIQTTPNHSDGINTLIFAILENG